MKKGGGGTGWPAVLTYFIVLYGVQFIYHIIFLALLSFIIVCRWLMSNKLIVIVIVIVR